MKSIKPGQGPCLLGAMGSVAAALFGVIWIVIALQMGAPGLFPLFGLVFIAMAVVQAVYHFRNAKGRDRYSVADIVDSQEEPDPLEQRWGRGQEEQPLDPDQQGESACFCPYCGTPVEGDYLYCKKCGRQLP